MSSFFRFVRAFTTPKAFFYYAISFLVWLAFIKGARFAASFFFLQHKLFGFWVGTALALYLIGKMVKYFMVSVPEVTGLVTINVFTGKMNTYGTGLHFRLPWEQAKVGNYINLRTAKTDDKEETFPCKDGPTVIVKWSLQYGSSVEQLPAYISIDEDTINKGLNEVASSFLALKIREMDSEDIRKENKKKELEDTLFEHFQKTATVPVNGKREHLEDFYGIRLRLVTIADVDFEAAYQAARTAEQALRKMKETAKKVVQGDGGDGSITDKDALDTVMMTAGKNVKKDISQETRVYDVSPTLASVFKAMAEAFTKK